MGQHLSVAQLQQLTATWSSCRHPTSGKGRQAIGRHLVAAQLQQLTLVDPVVMQGVHV